VATAAAQHNHHHHHYNRRHHQSMQEQQEQAEQEEQEECAPERNWQARCAAKQGDGTAVTAGERCFHEEQQAEGGASSNSFCSPLPSDGGDGDRGGGGGGGGGECGAMAELCDHIDAMLEYACDAELRCQKALSAAAVLREQRDFFRQSTHTLLASSDT
jgi:hypothetical protein